MVNNNQMNSTCGKNLIRIILRHNINCKIIIKHFIIQLSHVIQYEHVFQVVMKTIQLLWLTFQFIIQMNQLTNSFERFVKIHFEILVGTAYAGC